MRPWTNQNKLLTQLRRHGEKQALTDPVSAQMREESDSPSESDTSSRRAAEFLEFAQAAGGFGVFELNLVTGHIKGTSLFFELIGLECRDMSLTREEWLASIHPEDLESVVHALSDAVATGSGYETEYRTLTAAGEMRWLAGRGQVLLGGEGYDSRAIGTFTDITERKALEEKLHYATESLNIAQTAAGVATFDFDFRRNSRICSTISGSCSVLSRQRPSTISITHSRGFIRTTSRTFAAHPREQRRRTPTTAANTGCCSITAANAGSARRRKCHAAPPARWSASPAPSSISAI